MTTKQLKKMVKRSGLKQNHIASKLGISREHLSRVLNGRVRLTGHIALNLECITRESQDVFVRENQDDDAC